MDWESRIRKKKENAETVMKDMKEELKRLSERNNKELRICKEKHFNKVKELKTTNTKEIEQRRKRLDDDLRRYKEEIKGARTALDSTIAAPEKEIRMLKAKHERIVNEENHKIVRLSKEKDHMISDHKKEIERIEEDIDIELTSMMRSHGIASHQENKTALLLKEENDIMKKKYDALLKDYEEHKETILSLEEKQCELATAISDQDNCKEAVSKRLVQQDIEMSELEDRINEITEQTHEMEKYVGSLISQKYRVRLTF